MAISIFPSTAAEFVSNNFVVDMNDTSNNTADTGGVKQAGPYSMSFSSGDTSFDVYLIDEDGNSVGYSNNTSIVASGLFSTVVILGVAQDEIVSFLYQGSVNNADGEGDEPGAGAYLESISPSDLPSIDDTATVIGGNFGADTEIKFESGATVLDAKNITVNNSTELIVTRPDNLDADLDPWTLRAITTGVAEPTGTNANILTDAVTAGAVPSWVTTSPLASGTVNVAYTDTLEATDADGTVVDYSITSGALPAGLTFNSSTGVISGTPTGQGQTFTATATDDGGNTTSREFKLPMIAATGGTITEVNGEILHTFSSSDDFEALVDLEISYVLVGGGGGGGASFVSGGGGGGGIVSTFAGDTGAGTPASITAGTYAVTVGAGGAAGANGSSSSIATVGTALGGGAGGAGGGVDGFSGAAGGGGGARNTVGGTGSNGGDGGNNLNFFDAGAGGGGGGAEGTNGQNASFPAQTGGNASQGGTGTSTSISGSSVTYSDGGNGGLTTGRGGLGPNGFGGDGATPAVVRVGGDGIVIVRYS